MWTIAVSGKKKLRIQKYPDTCGRGLSFLQNVVKRFFNLKKCLKKRQGEFKKKQIVLIRVHLETGHLHTVVQRFKVTFIREIFGYPFGRPGDLFCIRETPGLSGRVGMYANEERQCLSICIPFPV